MGRGNWIPSKPKNGGIADESEFVYVDIPTDEMGLPEGSAAIYAWEDFLEELQNLLPASFQIADDYDERDFIYSRTSRPIFSNKLCYVVVDEEGYYYHQGIGFVLREDAPAFAARTVQKTARKVFDKLATRYSLSLRNGAWMSTPYPIQPETQKV